MSYGWQETGVVKSGQFTVLETVKNGPLATFDVTGHSADLLKTLKQQKTRSWTDGKMLGDVLNQVARDNGLSPAIDQSLSQVPIDKISPRSSSPTCICARGWPAIMGRCSRCRAAI